MPESTMTIERAETIVGAMNAHAMWEMGILDKIPPSLSDYSLREMLDASHAVGNHPGHSKCKACNAPMDSPVRAHLTPGGAACPERATVTEMMFRPEDRLVAALYTAYHYQANPKEAICLTRDHRAVVVVRLTKDDEVEDA